MSLKSEKANSAMENYLDDLFVEPKSSEQKPNTRIQSNKIQTKKHYDLGRKTSEVSQDQRHQIERVERLLEDYNQRQNQVDVAEPINVSLLRPVLEPIVDIEESVQKQAITETEVTQTESTDLQSTDLQSTDDSEVIKQTYQSQFRDNAFQALVFNVAGMDLAVPLISLGGINRIDKEVTQLFGKPDWFMGLTPGIEGNINVVDSCRWVMPEKYGEAKTKGLNYSFIIMLGDSKWGLACSHVQNAIKVEPDNIKWRSHDSKRPWLAGMLIEERCVLLDVDIMVDLLDSDYQR